ncbi:MAG: rhodanese-like domain-containing protein [Thermaceae bacterium]
MREKGSLSRRALLGLFLIPLLAACGAKGKYEDVGPEELYSRLSEGVLVVDVRTPQEFAQGHVPEAKNYPLQSIDTWWRELPKDKPIYLYCNSGNRSRQAAEYLKAKGFTNLYNVQGGVLAIERAGYPLVR